MSNIKIAHEKLFVTKPPLIPKVIVTTQIRREYNSPRHHDDVCAFLFADSLPLIPVCAALQDHPTPPTIVATITDTEAGSPSSPDNSRSVKPVRKVGVPAGDVDVGIVVS